jgi:3-oxoacyl-[acyl-carrier protein] reductase
MIFKNKNILVVGGSSGIGFALVSPHARTAVNVFNLSRTSNDHWPPEINHLSFDVLAANESAASSLPKILHGLGYMPGTINLKPFNSLNEEDFLNDYHVNVLGAVKMIRKALPAPKKFANVSILLLSLVSASLGMPFHAGIAAAKGAVNRLTLALAPELAPFQIQVNAIAPSLIETPLTARFINSSEKQEAAAARRLLGRLGALGDIAASIIFLLSEESSWMTGQILGIDAEMGCILKIDI